jgi:hypothetical protein
LSALLTVLCSNHSTYHAHKVQPRLSENAEAELLSALTRVPKRHWLFLLALLLMDQTVMMDNIDMVDKFVAKDCSTKVRKVTTAIKQELEENSSFDFAQYPRAVHAILFSYILSLCEWNGPIFPVDQLSLEMLQLRAIFAFSSDHLLSAHALCNFPLGRDLSLSVAVDSDAYFFALKLMMKGSHPARDELDLHHLSNHLSKQELKKVVQPDAAHITPIDLFNQLHFALEEMKNILNRVPLQVISTSGKQLHIVQPFSPLQFVPQQERGRDEDQDVEDVKDSRDRDRLVLKKNPKH